MTATFPAIGIASLRAGMLACARCGTPTSGEEFAYTVLGRDHGTRIEEMNTEVTFGMCDTCRARDEHARALVAAHPSIRRAVGSPAVHRVSGALDALALLNATVPATLTDERLHDLLALSTVGIGARWASRFSPMWAEGASMKQAASEPWLFASIEVRKEARHLYGAWLADSLPPVAVACPSRGCAWCGLRTTSARRSQVRTVWRPYGRGGHLCPTCAASHESGEDFHDTFLAYIDPDRAIRRRTPEPPMLQGVHKWQDGNGGDGTPWSHLGERETLRQHVAALIGVSVR